MTAPPARAVRVLIKTYWSSTGWRPDPSTAPKDLAEAVAAGVMFDAPVALDHDQLVMDIRRVANDTSLEDASAASCHRCHPGAWIYDQRSAAT